MKILMISQGLPFPIYLNGLTIRVYHLLRQFSKQATCHLIAFGDYELTKDDLKAIDEMASNDIVSHQNTGNQLQLLMKILSSRRYYDKVFEKKIVDAKKTFKPDVIFVEQTFMAQYVNLIEEYPKVMSAVDAISLAAMRQSNITKYIINKIAWRYIATQRLKIEKKYFPRFDKISVVSEDDSLFLKRKIMRDIDVVPNGVDTVYFSPKLLSPERKAIIFTANLSAPMNEETCIYLIRNVFPCIHKVSPGTPLVIAGRSPTQQIKNEMPDYVDLFADVDDIRRVMRHALLCVSPVAYGTGIKNNVLQAMAMGIPVIVNKLVSEPIGIISGETGIVAERGEDFVEAILLALKNKSELNRLGANGREHIEQYFSWEHVAKSYMKMFYDLIHKT